MAFSEYCTDMECSRKYFKNMMSTLSPSAGYTTHPGAMSPDMVWWAAANMSEVELIDINRQGHALTNHWWI